MQEMKLQDMTMTNQFARYEIAEPENYGPIYVVISWSSAITTSILCTIERESK